MVFIFMPQSIQAATTINFTSGAYREGNDVYYVLEQEYDSSSTYLHFGNIKKYNINTNTSTVVAKGRYFDVVGDSKYLYATENKYLGGSGDSCSCTIYRINKNGKSRKKLDHGESPVRIGKYLYYIKTASWNGLYQEPIGIYRMTTSGSNKKCILSMKYIYGLGYAGKKLYFNSGRYYYSVNLDGSNLKKINMKKYNSTENDYGDQKVTCKGWSYKSENSKILYAYKKGVKRKIATNYSYSDFFYIIQLKDRIMVRSTSKDARWWYFYIMKPDGTDRHYVCKTIRGN